MDNFTYKKLLQSLNPLSGLPEDPEGDEVFTLVNSAKAAELKPKEEQKPFVNSNDLNILKNIPKIATSVQPDESIPLFEPKPQTNPINIVNSSGLNRNPASVNISKNIQSKASPKTTQPAIPAPKIEQSAPVDAKKMMNDLFGAELNDAALKAAQEQANNSILAANLGRAASLIGSGIAGAKTPDLAGFDAIQKTANKGVEDIQTRRKAKTEELDGLKKMYESATLAEQADENSQVSKSAQWLYKKYTGKDIKASALQLKDILTNAERGYYADQMAASRRDAKEASRSAQDEARTEKGVQNFIKRTEDLANFDSALKEVNDLLAPLGIDIDKIDKLSGKVNGKKVDLPGVNLPLIGTRVSFYNQHARQIEDAFSSVFNALLKARSGVAVTDPEFNRLKQEFSSGAFRTEEEKLGAVKRFKDALSRNYKREYNASGEKVQNELKVRGVQPLFGDVEATRSPQNIDNNDMVSIITSDGKPGKIPKKNLEEAKKRDPGLRVL